MEVRWGGGGWIKIQLLAVGKREDLTEGTETYVSSLYL